MSKIVPGKIIRNIFHIYFMVAIIAVALSLGSVSGADGYIYRITGTTITKAATQLEVSTNAASVITATSATLNGNLTSLGTADSVNVSFEYGETTDYGKTTTAQKMTKTGTFTANLTGLTSGKTYHFRAMAAGDGTVTGDDATFTTTTSSKVTPLVVTTNAASGITATSATLNGNLTSLGTADSVNVSFEYGETTDYGKTTTAQKMTKTGTFTANLTGLTSGKTYHFRAMAAGDGTVTGDDATFTTTTSSKVTPPVVTTNAASGITATSATLNGNLTSLGTADSVNVSFEYGETTDYGKTTTAQKMTKTGTFTANLTGLTSGKTYHFRAMAAGDGTVTGNDATFTTTTSSKVTPPVVTTNAASGITATSATLNGNISDLGSGSSVLVSFEWGTTTAYGNTSQIRLLTKEGNFTAAPLTDLIAKTTYHFRAKAEGDGTVVYGKDATFTTTSLPASFTFTTFNITPSTSQAGDTVNISVTCNNIGGSPGTYPVVLKINGVSEQTEEINLDPGKSQVVSFAITESKAGTYEVNVNELTSSFVVQESSQLLSISTPAQSATLEESGWPLVAGIAGGTILVGLIVLFIFRRSIV